MPNHRLLHYRVEPADWLEWPDWLRAMGRGDLVLGEGVVFDNYPLLLQAAVAGQGIALGWRRTTQHLIDRASWFGRSRKACRSGMPSRSTLVGARRDEPHPELCWPGWMSD